MRVPKGAAGASNSATLATPAIVVILVLLLGAVIYLRHARYIRRRTAYVLIAAIVIALVCYAVWLYSHPM